MERKKMKEKIRVQSDEDVSMSKDDSESVASEATVRTHSRTSNCSLEELLGEAMQLELRKLRAERDESNENIALQEQQIQELVEVISALRAEISEMKNMISTSARSERGTN